jgi:AraC-like DNA-binding protein
MVIHDPNVMSITLDPFEDHSPLIIDSDRVKLLEIALELFQTIRWRYGQILQAACRVEGFELTLRHSGDARELTYPLIPEERPSGLVPERSDHQSAVLPHTGIRSTFVSRALSLLHGRMAGQWTVDDLGREVGLSRSALADRFTRLIGEPPMRYLARWRIQVAAHQLRHAARAHCRAGGIRFRGCLQSGVQAGLRSPSGYLAQKHVRLDRSCEITTQRCRYMRWTMRVARAIPRLASSRGGSEPAPVRTGYTGMIQFSPEDRFIWLKLVGNTMPPRHPNNDDNDEDNDEEGDDEEENDEREPAVIREPDEGE